MDTDEAFVVVQERVLETPGSISEKDAEKEEIVGSRRGHQCCWLDRGTIRL